MDRDRLQLFEEALNSLLVTLQPDQESDAARRLVVQDMQQLVAQTLPPNLHCSVETFGSFRAGLHLPGSDIDFALNGWVAGPDGRQLELHEWSSNEQLYLLQDLADALEKEQLVQDKVERVLHARVPVIKFVHALTGLHCDFSIHRPECCFKADMQKLLGSLDRRYATLYRLVKAWANAHGLNDAAAHTLNSWSLGLMVAFYLQCESPQVLPPIWQLLEQQPPSLTAPRILQLPNITTAMLKRVLNHAATGAGAFIGRRARGGEGGLNPKSPAELLVGFFSFYAPTLADWAAGRRVEKRASTWWGAWMDAGWSPAKGYIFSIEDPFHAGDNTARSVGTHNHLSSCNTASYIASCFAASADQLQRALSSSSSGGSSAGSSGGESPGRAQQDAGAPRPPASARDGGSGGGGSSGCGDSDAGAREVLAAFAWLFGPHAVLQAGELPPPLCACLAECVPAPELQRLRGELEELQDCLGVLSSSSMMVNSTNSSGGLVAARLARVEGALQAYKHLARLLGCGGTHDGTHDLCLRDFLARRRAIEKQQLAERERERQRWLQQQQQAQAAMRALSMGPAAAAVSGGQQQQQVPLQAQHRPQQQHQHLQQPPPHHQQQHHPQQRRQRSGRPEPVLGLGPGPVGSRGAAVVTGPPVGRLAASAFAGIAAGAATAAASPATAALAGLHHPGQPRQAQAQHGGGGRGPRAGHQQQRDDRPGGARQQQGGRDGGAAGRQQQRQQQLPVSA